MRAQAIYQSIKRFNFNVGRFIGKRNTDFICAWLNEIYCFMKFGCSPDDYFRYEFYKKSNFERRKFITYRKSQYLIRKYNSPKYQKILDDKAEFNKFFSEYINREWLDLRDTGREEFETFLYKHKEVIIKPIKGGQGIGIKKVSYGDYDPDDFEEIKNSIAEEVLHQAKDLDTLNPSSVNTVRVQTFKGKTIAAAIRIGDGHSIVDNLHSNGICGHIDLSSGIIDAPCINNRYDKFIFHPLTKVKLVGIEIPHWKEVLLQVENASKKLPEERYVGWDIAVLENGEVALIEGNFDPGHDVIQMIVQNGLWESVTEVKA